MLLLIPLSIFSLASSAYLSHGNDLFKIDVSDPETIISYQIYMSSKYVLILKHAHIGFHKRTCLVFFSLFDECQQFL